LRGERAEVHAMLMEILAEPTKNPRRGRLIDAFNLLGLLNKYIDAGQTEFIPLRDTVAAKIEGYLDEGALDYSLSEALADLSKTEVATLARLIKEEKVEEAPPMKQYAAARRARERLERQPEVRRARERVEAAEAVEEEYRKALRKGAIETAEFLVGPERLAQMKVSRKEAEEELGKVFPEYRPADKEKWQRATEIVNTMWPGFIPPKVPKGLKPIAFSVVRRDISRFRKMTDLRTPKAEREKIRDRINRSQELRRRNLVIIEYERLGGKPLTQREVKLREAQRVRAEGTPFKLRGGFFGVIVEGRAGKYDWKLFDPDGIVYFEGTAADKRAASREVNIAVRVVIDLIELGAETGWDNLPRDDRRWLEAAKPKLSVKVARMLLNKINEGRVKVSVPTAKWIVSAAELGAETKKIEEDVTKSCKDMGLGDTRILKGYRGQYNIHVTKNMRGKFTFYIVTKTGQKSRQYRTDDCDEVIRKANLIAGGMIGGERVAQSISNPGKIKRLENGAKKFFRENNPKMPRKRAEAGEIEELAGMVSVPYDPEQAYRYGFYAGIIRGIDTCGVQNYFQRRKVRKEYAQKLLEAAMAESERLTEPVRKRGARSS